MKGDREEKTAVKSVLSRYLPCVQWDVIWELGGSGERELQSYPSKSIRFWHEAALGGI